MDKGDFVKVVVVLLTSYLALNYFKYGEERPIAQTENGLVKGIYSYSTEFQRKYKSFMGIPYAKPPTNDLRFEAPESITENWNGIRDAGYYGSQCISVDILWSGFQFGDEDCLFLNVNVPVTKTNNSLAVLVFFHGGYWHLGSSQDHGERRWMDDDVIVVSANYRLGALGFLSSGDGVIRGNQGIKDQVMVLKWIQANIKNFQGDPNRVTIFGESVGAASVALHILSPLSKGLFHRGISQSGTALNSFSTYRKVSSQAKRFAAKFNCPTNDSKLMAKCLKGIDASTLVHEHIEAYDVFRNRQSMFAPTIEAVNDDKAFLAEEPVKILERGDFPKIPWILGVNSEEGLFSSSAIAVNKTKEKILVNWKTGFPSFLWYARNDPVSKKIKDFYFGNEKKLINTSNPNFIKNVTDMLSDRAFFHPLVKSAKLYSKHAETYLYYYNYRGFFSLENFFRESEDYFIHPALSMLLNQSWRFIKEFVLRIPVISSGSCHGDELALQFIHMWTPSFFSVLPQRDVPVSRNLLRAWTSFAKSWDKLQFDKIQWEPINPTDGNLKYLEINSEPKMIDEGFLPFTERMKFWDSIESELEES